MSAKAGRKRTKRPINPQRDRNMMMLTDEQSNSHPATQLSFSGTMSTHHSSITGVPHPDQTALSDLEKLRRLKDSISLGQHPFFVASPHVLALENMRSESSPVHQSPHNGQMQQRELDDPNVHDRQRQPQQRQSGLGNGVAVSRTNSFSSATNLDNGDYSQSRQQQRWEPTANLAGKSTGMNAPSEHRPHTPVPARDGTSAPASAGLPSPLSVPSNATSRSASLRSHPQASMHDDTGSRPDPNRPSNVVSNSSVQDLRATFRTNTPTPISPGTNAGDAVLPTQRISRFPTQDTSPNQNVRPHDSPRVSKPSASGYQEAPLSKDDQIVTRKSSETGLGMRGSPTGKEGSSQSKDFSTYDRGRRPTDFPVRGQESWDRGRRPFVSPSRSQDGFRNPRSGSLDRGPRSRTNTMDYHRPPFPNDYRGHDFRQDQRYYNREKDRDRRQDPAHHYDDRYTRQMDHRFPDKRQSLGSPPLDARVPLDQRPLPIEQRRVDYRRTGDSPPDNRLPPEPRRDQILAQRESLPADRFPARDIRDTSREGRDGPRDFSRDLSRGRPVAPESHSPPSHAIPPSTTPVPPPVEENRSSFRTPHSSPTQGRPEAPRDRELHRSHDMSDDLRTPIALRPATSGTAQPHYRSDLDRERDRPPYQDNRRPAPPSMNLDKRFPPAVEGEKRFQQSPTSTDRPSERDSYRESGTLADERPRLEPRQWREPSVPTPNTTQLRDLPVASATVNTDSRFIPAAEAQAWRESERYQSRDSKPTSDWEPQKKPNWEAPSRDRLPPPERHDSRNSNWEDREERKFLPNGGAMARPSWNNGPVSHPPHPPGPPVGQARSLSARPPESYHTAPIARSPAPAVPSAPSPPSPVTQAVQPPSGQDRSFDRARYHPSEPPGFIPRDRVRQRSPSPPRRAGFIREPDDMHRPIKRSRDNDPHSGYPGHPDYIDYRHTSPPPPIPRDFAHPHPHPRGGPSTSFYDARHPPVREPIPHSSSYAPMSRERGPEPGYDRRPREYPPPPPSHHVGPGGHPPPMWQEKGRDRDQREQGRYIPPQSRSN